MRITLGEVYAWLGLRFVRIRLGENYAWRVTLGEDYVW